MVVIDGSFVVEAALMIIFLLVGFYSLTRSSLSAPQGLAYLVVAAIFLILAVVLALALAGIGIT